MSKAEPLPLLLLETTSSVLWVGAFMNSSGSASGSNLGKILAENRMELMPLPPFLISPRTLNKYPLTS